MLFLPKKRYRYSKRHFVPDSGDGPCGIPAKCHAGYHPPRFGLNNKTARQIN